MSDPDPKETSKEEQPVKNGALKALAGSDRFTPEERQEIAATIESEIAKLLPDLPEGIADMAFKAVGLSLEAADRLVGRQENSAENEPSDP
jgi:hypothetical protein